MATLGVKGYTGLVWKLMFSANNSLHLGNSARHKHSYAGRLIETRMYMVSRLAQLAMTLNDLERTFKLLEATVVRHYVYNGWCIPLMWLLCRAWRFDVRRSSERETASRLRVHPASSNKLTTIPTHSAIHILSCSMPQISLRIHSRMLPYFVTCIHAASMQRWCFPATWNS